MSAPSVPARVTVCEVGPRDGLQNERTPVATADKIRYIDLLMDAGFAEIEVTSFVNPKAVPQLADAEQVYAGISPSRGRRIALVPNERGLDRALAAGLESIAVFTAASDAFAQRNIGMSIDESLATFARVIARAKTHGLWVRASISTAFGCPFAGAVSVDAVVAVAQRLLDIGADELSVADTIGVGTPNQVYAIVAALEANAIPLDRIGLHFHDTRGIALANTVAALHAGIALFDSSAGGLGGCPFAPGATGNVATEDLLYLLHGMGIETGIDLDAVRRATRFIGGILTGRINSRAYHALEAAPA
jgi:hydroxymethylglutaryl-CoA lyase